MVLCSLSAANAAAIPVVNGFELIGARNVDVNGVLYDVVFTDGPCTGVYTGCDEPSDFAFSTEADARAAGQALLDQVFQDRANLNFDRNPLLTRGCDDLLFGRECGTTIPFGDIVTFSTGDIGVRVVVVANANDEAFDDIGVAGQTPSNDLRGVDFANYAVFTLVDPGPVDPIPVPAALPLFLAGLAGLRMVRRRSA